MSGSRAVGSALTLDKVAVDGDAKRLRTSDSQRSCAVRSGEMWSAGVRRPKPPVATRMTATMVTQPAAAAISHVRIVFFRGIGGGELSISYLSRFLGYLVFVSASFALSRRTPPDHGGSVSVVCRQRVQTHQ